MCKALEVTQSLVSFPNTPTVLWLLSRGVTVTFWHLTCFWGRSSNTCEGAGQAGQRLWVPSPGKVGDAPK